MSGGNGRSKPISIPVVSAHPTAAPSGEPPGANPMETQPSPAEAWQAKREALTQAGHNRDWATVLRILTDLSSSRRFPEVRKALAQRVWVALKSDAPGIDVVTALREMVMTITPRHELAGPMGALAYFMGRNRQPQHPDREFAVAMAQQLLHLICSTQGVGEGEGDFQQWVKENHLEKPDNYISRILEGLEIMVMGGWWFDRDALQQELLNANRGGGR
ncbi:MAG: hypothetical protein HQL82_07140 [Magnetococcales bacterium]|nr:hypothetical protein [Magnetococcales bacterium]